VGKVIAPKGDERARLQIEGGEKNPEEAVGGSGEEKWCETPKKLKKNRNEEPKQGKKRAAKKKRGLERK